MWGRHCKLIKFQAESPFFLGGNTVQSNLPFLSLQMCNIPLLVKAISKCVHDMWGRHGKLINFQTKSVGMAKNKQNNNWHEDGCGFFLFLPKLKLASCQRGTSSLACFCHWVLKFDNRIEWCAKWSIICLKCINSHISLSSSKVKSQGTGSSLNTSEFD